MRKPTLEELTLREKIGQTCIKEVHTSGGRLSYFEENPNGTIFHARYFINRDNVRKSFAENGYEMAYDENFSEKFPKWLDDVNSKLKVPTFVALDAEGGLGSEVPNASYTPMAACIGSANDEQLAFDVGRNIATEAKAMGCRWIWGPVADNPSMMCGVMSIRNYSYDIEHISRMLTAQIKGMQSVGVAATAKHFPGADRHEYRDAHYQPSKIGYTMEEWEKEQGRAFQAAIDAGVYSVMVGHSAFPAADDTEADGIPIPATLSYKIVTELLKEKMGFKGVVVTDGIGMRGLSAFYKGKDLYVALLRAGNDAILGPQDDYIDAVEQAVLSGEMPESRIDDACQRILDMKEKLGMFDDNYHPGTGITDEMRATSAATNKEIARRGMVMLANKNGLIPVNASDIKNVTIVYDGYSDVAYDNLQYMVEEFERHGARAKYRRSIESDEVMKAVADESDLIIYVSYIGAHCPKGMPFYQGADNDKIKYILGFGKEKSIGVSLNYPFMYYNYFLNMPVYINSFGSGRQNIEELVKGIYGEFKFNTESLIPIKPEF